MRLQGLDLAGEPAGRHGACAQLGGHLAIRSGTDLALFNTLFTYIADRGWVDADFSAASTFRGGVAQAEGPAHPASLTDSETARAACRMSLAEGAAICGVAEADIVKAAEWIAKPKEDGARRRAVFPTRRGSSGATTTTAPSAHW